MHAPPCRWRHFELVKLWPQNFVTLGDTIAALNPTFGQGMTHAAIGAELLDRYFTQQRQKYFPEGWWEMSREFQISAAAQTQVFWDMSMTRDFPLKSSLTNPSNTSVGSITNRPGTCHHHRPAQLQNLVECHHWQRDHLFPHIDS
jgi:hypothetical protein